jgi:hypothetical protein
MIYVWMFVPVFFHATQHWAVAWMTEKKECASDSTEKRPSTLQDLIHFCKFALPIQVVSLAVLFWPLFFQLEAVMKAKNHTPFSGPEFTLALEWSILVFYMHYFADRIVWRSEPKGETS